MEGTLLAKSKGGFTLVELMVTLGMTAIIVGAIYTTFGVQQKLYVTEEQIIGIQQNGRVAMEFLTRDLRRAGFWGCSSTDGTFSNTLQGYDNATNFRSHMFPVEGLDNAGAGYNAKAGTDIVFLSYADANGSILMDENMVSTSSSVHVNHYRGILTVGDIALISEPGCTQSTRRTTFQITDLQDGDRILVHHDNNQSPQNPGNWTPHLPPPNPDGSFPLTYPIDSFVYPMIQKRYWIAPDNTLRVSTNGVINTNPIAEEIEDLQFEYGTDSNADGMPDQWDNATKVANAKGCYHNCHECTTCQRECFACLRSNWNAITAIRINIVTKSAKADRPQPSGASDGYHRFLLQRSVTLRNRWF